MIYAVAYGLTLGVLGIIAGGTFLAALRITLALATMVMRALRLFKPTERVASPIEGRFAYHLRECSIAFDRFGNTLLGGRANETISSRIGRNARDGHWFAVICEHILDPVAFVVTYILTLGQNPDRNHCQDAIEE